ncbi:uncharacterized protein DNG_08281 [Cephalotrichum gorgonifer]|uniref:Mediator of RNA polymerase II transcription subunit 18 n=1 Tax=Cephalotrichum gorgonifer TaxID=2041049 RepID=A0AAE8SY87_9PEZI|nr:uncharacterized protein DNG_08281 [Cephalotrichum gorgonifer]
MYELSLLAFVDDKDVPASLSVLSGLCSQSPWESIHRVHFLHGPGRPTGMPNPSPTPTNQQKDVPALWKELDRALGRQSYHLQLRYEVSKADFGKADGMDFNAAPGILRWVDFPEPAQAVPGAEKGVVMQRKKVEIWGQKNLHSVLAGNSYSLTSDQIEHGYSFFRDDIEICLHRYLLPRPQGQPPSNATAPTNPLPPWDSVTNVDDLQHWMLVVKLHVLQDNKPDEVRKAQEQLVALKNELDGVFQFEVIDRQFFDSRVPLADDGTTTGEGWKKAEHPSEGGNVLQDLDIQGEEKITRERGHTRERDVPQQDVIKGEEGDGRDVEYEKEEAEDLTKYAPEPIMDENIRLALITEVSALNWEAMDREVVIWTEGEDDEPNGQQAEATYGIHPSPPGPSAGGDTAAGHRNSPGAGIPSLPLHMLR